MTKNYLYLLRAKEKPNLVKIGDTTRDVEKRNQETITNSSLHRHGKKKVHYPHIV